MLAYTIRRILMTIPVMAVVALVVFSLLYLMPGDPAAVIAGEHASPDEVEKIRISLGLDRPFFVRFGIWLWQIVNGDLGQSIFTNLPVLHMIGQRVAPTLSLLLLALTIAISIAVPLGVLAAWKRGKAMDRFFMLTTTMSFSVPTFVVGYMLAFYFATTLRWLPVQGFTPITEGVVPFLRNLILPAVTLGLAFSALIARVTRSSMLEVLTQDYVRTAKAKGVMPMRILFRHALKNASIPVVTVVGIGLASLISGSVVTEGVFAIPGIGRLTLDAILHRDYPVIQGIVLVFSVTNVMVNLAVDLIYRALDPRIRY